MLIPLGILASAGGVPPVLPAFELIETISLTGSAASVTFNNLSTYASTYKHLQVRAVVRSSFTGGGITGGGAQFNSDTGNNYAEHALSVNATSIVSSGTANSNVISCLNVPNDGPNTGVYAGNIIDLLDPFSTTKNKTLRIFGGMTGSSPDYLSIGSGHWRSLSAVNIWTLLCYGTTFRAGSRFSLYGIRG